MNFQSIRITSIAKVSVVLVSILFSSAGFAVDSINGNSCTAANLNQAFDLKWDHARVSNPSNVARFVTCTIGSGPEWLDPAPDLASSAADGGSVSAYFSETSADGAEVSCIFREMSNISTTLVATDSKAVTIVADDPLPDAVIETFGAADGIRVGNPIGTASLTVTCKLDPGTGINSITVSKIKPPAT